MFSSLFKSSCRKSLSSVSYECLPVCLSDRALIKLAGNGPGSLCWQVSWLGHGQSGFLISDTTKSQLHECPREDNGTEVKFVLVGNQLGSSITKAVKFHKHWWTAQTFEENWLLSIQSKNKSRVFTRSLSHLGLVEDWTTRNARESVYHLTVCVLNVIYEWKSHGVQWSTSVDFN